MHRVCRIGGRFYLVYSPEDGKVILRRIWTESVVEDERNAVTEGCNEQT